MFGVERAVGSSEGRVRSCSAECLLPNFTANSEIFVLSLLAVCVSVRRGVFECFLLSCLKIKKQTQTF